jgi:hypothetical protein
VPKTISQTQRITLLLKAVKLTMEKRGVTADQLGVQTEIGYLKIKHWFAGSGFPKGEHTLRLLEWVTGSSTKDFLKNI